jgi:urea transport system substrate-binding protein
MLVAPRLGLFTGRAAASYFQSLDTKGNQEFLHRLGQRYGSERVVSGAMATAYAGVHLWAQAVAEAGRDDARAVRTALQGKSYDAPCGPLRIDPATRHTAQFARVGRVAKNGSLVEVYASPQPVAPEPFPACRSTAQWTNFLDGLHRRWGGRWSNAAP